MTQVFNGKSQIESALEVAAKAHHKQYRKGTDTPYITHPYAVGMLLMEAGCAETVIIAGLLHDTVEDTDLTLELIRKRFGEQVAAIVDGCSENKALKWKARKTERIEALATASPEVCLVTCADKLHNLRTVISEISDHKSIGTDAVWERFHGGIEAQAWYYQAILESLRKQMECGKIGKSDNVVHGQFNSIFQDLQRAVAYLFKDVTATGAIS